VSTILNALKKLEQEQEQEGHRYGAQRHGADLNTRQVFNRAVRFAWIKSVGIRWGVIGAVALLVTLGFVYFQINRQENGKESAREQEVTSIQQPPAENRTINASVPDDSSSDTMPPSEISSKETPELASSEPPKRSEAEPLQPSFDPDQNAEPVSREDREPAVSPIPAETFDRYPGAQPLTDGRLKVQAIAWSPDPEDRVAVVNNRIVHKGDAVDGFIVLAVESERLVVRAEGKVWVVFFGQP
jgi:hypothetical protein